METNSVFDRALIERFGVNAPRYTSYPTADRFSLNFTQADHKKNLQQLDPSKPVSLYIHIPFCNTLCLFCACNKIITNDRTNIKIYLEYLEKEILLYQQIIGKKLKVAQLHFGGGSPSWLSIDELNSLMHMLSNYFDLSQALEIAMEIDPRHCNEDFVKALSQHGFNRISIGVQDFNPKVQKAVNRVQSFESSKAIIDAARQLNFISTNIDLIYGLPFQTKDSFSKTLEQVIEIDSSRIALFNYAHLPSVFMPQTRISEEDLPKSHEKLDILQLSIEMLTQAGFMFIGMDHFAKEGDQLTQALKEGTLQRNFQGYSILANTSLISFGVSAIGMLNNSYYQNVKDLETYYRNLDLEILPIFRGINLESDDILRFDIIQKIMCTFKLDFKEIEQKFNIDFKNYFQDALEKLNELENFGLINLYERDLKVTSKGRFLIRNIVVVFDKYFNFEKSFSNSTKYSKTI